MKSPKYIVVLVAMGLTGLAYQNCGGPPAEFGDSSMSSLEDLAPFAYESSLDHISYMSCRKGSNTYSGNVSDQNAFFTFRAGAYGNSAGIRLKESFFNYADEIYDPPYGSNVPAGQATPEQMIELLQLSPENKNAQLQVSLRTLNNVRVEIITTEANAIIPGADFQNLFGPLTNDTLAAEMAKGERGRWFKSFNSGTGFTGRQVEASLYFQNTNEGTFYSMLRNDGLLTTTFTMDPDEIQGKNTEVIARGPDDEDLTKAYGTGYRMNFSFGHSNEASAPTRIMSSVEEIDLATREVSSPNGWRCPPDLRFVIVHPQHQATACAPEDYDLLSANERAIRDLARRHLRAGYWDINLRQRCVVPKAEFGTCYSVDPTVRNINYAPTESTPDCSERDTSKPACAHYVSMCVRI